MDTLHTGKECVIVLVGPCKYGTKDEKGYRISRLLEQAGLYETCRSQRILDESDLRFILGIFQVDDEEYVRQVLISGDYIVLLMEGDNSRKIAKDIALKKSEICVVVDTDERMDYAMTTWMDGIREYFHWKRNKNNDIAD